jgi:DNA primase
MAGRIRDEDIALVRDRSRVDDIIREYVSLKPAGGGSFKGLCPFHEERSPSFNVTPSRGMWHCFGCGEGGDVFTFVEKIDHLSFAEAVEKLARRANIELRYAEGGSAINRQQGQRTRLVEAHRLAAAFFVERLGTAEAAPGREFLAARRLDGDAARTFGVGFAPRSWDALTSHLRKAGFRDDELLAGGLVSQGNRGVYDRFRGRLVWPIRDPTGDVIGFGARKLADDDDGPKYLNTPETPLYRKSQVLYGIDLARSVIAREREAVVVEGYTDVMACHLAGVTNAVATCGTAFGAEHIKVLRRLLMDSDQMRGRVVFTFDGDAAGQKAALRAFDEDQQFVSQTFVAVEPAGLDPCDLRLQQSDAAVRALVDSRVPLFEFAIRAQLAGHDLDSAEGRIAGLREAAPVVARIRDVALRPEYARRLAGWLGMDVEPVVAAVNAAAGGRSATPAPARPPVSGAVRDTAQTVEREALKSALQQPAAVERWYAALDESAFTHPSARSVHRAIAGAGGPRPELDGHAWIEAVLAAAEDDAVRRLVRELAVEPLPAPADQDARYAVNVTARLLEMDTTRKVDELRGRLQRTEPDEAEHAALFAELMRLEEYRRALRDDALGAAS